MTQYNETTRIQDGIELIAYEQDRKTILNARYGKISQVDNQTTEERLVDVRKTMRYYRPAQTFGREHGRINGYYYTEPVDIARVGV